MSRLMVLLLPNSLFYADDQLTVSAKRLLARLAVAALALCVAAVAFGLLDAGNWREVMAGAILAWAVSLGAWAPTSYRASQAATRDALTAAAERDLLHARLNHLASRCGAPLVDLVDGQLQEVLGVQEERHAHLSGLEEFRTQATERGWTWWDNTAVGVEIEADPQPRPALAAHMLDAYRDWRRRDSVAR